MSAVTPSTPDAGAAGTFALGDLDVRRLGFGAMRLTGTRPFHLGEPRDRAESVAVLRRAVELGVNHIDTASFYFSSTRSANELIASALGPYPDDLVIVTKVGPYREESGEWGPARTPETLRGQVEENLRQLGRDHLDVVNFRTQGPGPVAESVGALADLVQAGLVRHIGISNVTLEQYDEARAVAPIVCVQNRHSLDTVHEGAESLLERCGGDGVAFVPFFAIAGASMSGGGEQPAAVEEIASARGVSAAQVRLAWSLALGDHVLAIPGTGSVAHLEDNVAAAAVRLAPDEVSSLSALAG